MHATPAENRFTQSRALPGGALNRFDGKWVDARQRSKSYGQATGAEIEGVKGARARKRASFYFANHFWLTTSGHYHTRPFREALEQIGEDRMLFSVDYPYRRISAAAGWFDEAQFSHSLKLKVGPENANLLLRLNLE